MVDKATKLHALFDRIELIDTRFEVVRRDLELELCRARLDVRQNGDGESLAAIERKCAARLAEIDVDRAFLRRCNRMDPEPIDAIDTSKIPGYVDPPAQ